MSYSVRGDTPLKIGDKVQLKENAYQIPAGTAATIIEILNSNVVRLKGERNTGSTFEFIFYRYEFELSTESPPRNGFKKGDEVRFLEDYLYIKKGEIGTVVGFWSQGLKVEVGAQGTVGCYYYRVEKLNGSTFKVGDRVRVKACSEPSCVGDEWTIEKIEGNQLWYNGLFFPYEPEKGDVLEKVSEEPFDGVAELNEAIRDVAMNGGCYYFPSNAMFVGNGINKTIIKPKKMSIIKAIKAKLSSVDRVLVKHGYLTNTGERTTQYNAELEEAALEKLIEAEDTKEFREELAKELKEDNE